jgi:anti-sigma regulatory factor (Ser/Thr protein kinase)
MDNRPFTSIRIEDRSYVALAKREIHDAAVLASFNASRVGVIDIAVAELTSNIIKHAGAGELLYRITSIKQIRLFEIISIDDGPGIKDISNSMRDGVTTTKTLGNGLGALKRISDTFHIYSIENWGTICYSAIYSERLVQKPNGSEIRFSALNVSKPGQTVSGDGFEVVYNQHETKIIMGDGLGHGILAHEAIQDALLSFKICPENDPAKILKFLHDPAKKTRGLVATAVTVDHRSKKWKICGIGNISTRLFEGRETKNYISYNGIIGLNMPNTLKNHEAELTTHQCLIMSTDGIKTRWEISQFPSIMRYDPFMLAAVLYKECGRKNDDMSILIART